MEKTSVGLFSIKEIFQGKIFRIPDYQRGYSWKEEHINALWEDIMSLVGSDNQIHYTGMITVQSPSEMDIQKWKREFDSSFIQADTKGINIDLLPDHRPYYIADGQQRITSIVLLLTAIRDSNKFFSNDEIERVYLRRQIENTFIYLFGYEVDSPSYEYLVKRILNKTYEPLSNPETSYTENIRLAKGFFDKKVNELNDLEIHKLYLTLVNDLKFNYYELPEPLNIFTVFETMNYRGKALSNLELLKNRLIYLTSISPDLDKFQKDELRFNINEAWIKIYQTLARNKDKILNDDDYLRIHWLIYFNHDYKGNKDLSKYKQHLLDELFIKRNLFSSDNEVEHVTVNLIQDYVDSIAECVEAYFELKFPYHETNTQLKSIKYWLAKINYLYPKSYFEPLILAALVKRESQEVMIALLQNIERYIFLVFGLAGMRSNTNKTPFLIESNKYFKRDKDINLIINKMKPELGYRDKTLKSREPIVKLESAEELIDDFFRNRQKDRSDEGFLCWKFLKYFMLEYEENLKELNLVNVNEIFSKSSLELIFPPIREIPKKDNEKAEKNKDYNEKRTKNWSSCMKSYGKDTGQMYLCYTLGNIVLTDKDKREDSPNAFMDKKGRYENGSSSEQEIFQEADWTPKEILTRGIRLLFFMEKRWQIEIDYQLKKQILYLNQLNINDDHIIEREFRDEKPNLFTDLEPDAAPSE